MEKTTKNTVIALTGLLQRIDTVDNLRDLCHEAGELAQNVDPKDIAIAEQTLVENGYSLQVAHQLSTMFMFMGMYDQSSHVQSEQLADNHILRRVRAEHDLYRCSNAELRELTETIIGMDEMSDLSVEFRSLVRVARHLYTLREHMEREEDVIFPYIKKHGHGSLCRAAEREHAQLRQLVDNMMALILSFNGIPFEEFQIRLTATTKMLCPLLLDHLAFEDNLLNPMSLVVIENPETWTAIKALCDQIGYCEIHA